MNYWNYRTQLKQIRRKVEVPVFFEFEKLSKIMSNNSQIENFNL